MNEGFIYSRYVTGRNFLGRRKDLALLGNLLSSGESVVVYDEPGTGKMSLIQQALMQMRMDNPSLVVAQLSFLRSRTLEQLLRTFMDAVIKSCVTLPQQYKEVIAKFLSGTHFVFDQSRYDIHGEIVSTNWMLDEVDVQKALELPSALSQMTGAGIIIIVDEFQNVLFSDESDMLLDWWEKIVARQDRRCPFVFTGSRFNGMREIFDVQRRFWRSVVRLTPERIPSTDIADYINHGFQVQGKVIDKEQIALSADILRGNMHYVNHLFSIVDHSSRGFINKTCLEESLNTLLAIYEPRFFATVCSLTDFQLSLLRAIVDGEVKFSSIGTIDRYNLNSSANVKRLKDALVKKEIVWFDGEDVPHIQDPLLELWLRKVYFAG